MGFGFQGICSLFQLFVFYKFDFCPIHILIQVINKALEEGRHEDRALWHNLQTPSGFIYSFLEIEWVPAVGWPVVPTCLRWRSFLGLGTFGVKTGTILGKQESLATLHFSVPHFVLGTRKGTQNKVQTLLSRISQARIQFSPNFLEISFYVLLFPDSQEDWFSFTLCSLC